jgi:hypothetical protein
LTWPNEHPLAPSAHRQAPTTENQVAWSRLQYGEMIAVLEPGSLDHPIALHRFVSTYTAI